MKIKIGLLFLAIVLVSATCLLAESRLHVDPLPQDSKQQQPSPDPTIIPAANLAINSNGIPTIGYRIINKEYTSGGFPDDAMITLYEDGNMVAALDNRTIWPMGPIVVFAGNQQEVLFTIQQGGLGDGASVNTNAYELNVHDGTVKTLLNGDYESNTVNVAQDFDVTPDLRYLYWVSQASLGPPTSYAIHRVELRNGDEQVVRFVPYGLKTLFFLSNIRTSPDESKVAVAIEVPAPGQQGVLSPWQVWIIDWQTQRAAFFAKGGMVGSQWIALTGWTNSSTPSWR